MATVTDNFVVEYSSCRGNLKKYMGKIFKANLDIDDNDTVKYLRRQRNGLSEVNAFHYSYIIIFINSENKVYFA